MAIGSEKRICLSGGLWYWAQVSFSFVDYFYEAKYYRTPATFRECLDHLNLSQFELKPLHDMIAVPLLLGHPKILGKVGILYGRK